MMHTVLPIGAAAPANCQGSWVLSAPAEKALSSARISPMLVPCGQSLSPSQSGGCGGLYMSQPVGAAAPANCQGSWVLSAPAEKALSSARIGPTLVACGQPSNLMFLRLDGWNPHKHWIRQPPNLANLHAHTRTPACARIRVRRSFVSVQLKNRLDRLGGWRDQYPCGFQPSNLFGQPFEVGHDLTGIGQLVYRRLAFSPDNAIRQYLLLTQQLPIRVAQGVFTTLQRRSPHQYSLSAGYAGFSGFSCAHASVLLLNMRAVFTYTRVHTLRTLHTLLRASVHAGSNVAGLVFNPASACMVCVIAIIYCGELRNVR